MDDDDESLVVIDEDTSSFSLVDVSFSLIKSSLAGGGERSSSRLTIDDAFIVLFIIFYLFDGNK